VHKPVDGHLGDSHQRGYLGHGQEANLRQTFVRLGWTRHLLAPILSRALASAGRACHQYGIDAFVTGAMRSVKWPGKCQEGAPQMTGFTP
jgi:hypothetical protein